MGSDGATVDLAEIRRAAGDGLVWGLPLVLWDLVRRAHPRTNEFFALGSDAGELAPGLKAIHGDMCSASAILDLAAGPVSLSLPSAHGAVLSLLLHDGWGRIFAVVGTREAHHANRIEMVGPAWTGRPPPESEQIRAPGHQVWAINHILGAGEGGREDARRLQRMIAITTAGGHSVSAEAPDPLELHAHRGFDQALDVMTPLTFFRRLALLLPSHRPALQPSMVTEVLGRLDIEPGRAFDLKAWPRDQIAALDQGFADGLRRVRRARAGLEPGNQPGWSLSPPGARAGAAPLLRAALALAGLGASPSDEQMIFSTRTDADKRLLVGGNDYRLAFDAGAAPPANGYWSLCLTDPSGAPLDAPFSRLDVGEWFGLPPSVSKPIEVRVQADRAETADHWLRAPRGAFGLRLELRWPELSALRGAWRPPEVVNLGPSATHLWGPAAGKSGSNAALSSNGALP